MSMKTTSSYSLLAHFQAADAAWTAELIRIFGKRRARDIRYTKRSDGEPGSNLRLLYENRQMAMNAWHKSVAASRIYG